MAAAPDLARSLIAAHDEIDRLTRWRGEEGAKIKRQRKALTDLTQHCKRVEAERDGLARKVAAVQRSGDDLAHSELADLQARVHNQRQEIDRLRADALAAQAAFAERVAEAADCGCKADKSDCLFMSGDVTFCYREGLPDIRALAPDTGVKALAELRSAAHGREMEWATIRDELVAERDDALARLVEAEGRVKALTEARRDQIEARVEAVIRRNFVAPEDAAVETLCLRFGYGAVMDAAARLWARSDMLGAFYIGGCIGFRTEAEATAALSPAGEAGQ